MNWIYLIQVMINSSKMKKIYTVLTVFLCAFNFVQAQYANQQTLYNSLPQAKYTNPGIMPEYSVVLFRVISVIKPLGFRLGFIAQRLSSSAWL